MTGTSFSSRHWYEKVDGDDRLSQKEQLQEACWNGLLVEMLPEICKKPENNQKLIVWRIREAMSFLELDLGEFLTNKEQQYSIDPYCFLAMQSYN
jgi:hypothetical protein